MTIPIKVEVPRHCLRVPIMSYAIKLTNVVLYFVFYFLLHFILSL